MRSRDRTTSNCEPSPHGSKLELRASKTKLNGSTSTLGSLDRVTKRSVGPSRQVSVIPKDDEKKEKTVEKQYEAERVETGQVHDLK